MCPFLPASGDKILVKILDKWYKGELINKWYTGEFDLKARIENFR